MKKVILFAMLAFALVAVPAFASVQNVKVSGDIDNTWLVRHDFDLGTSGAAPIYEQNLFLTQTRLRVDADLTDNVQATVGLLNERVWQEANDDVANDIDLNLAYVTMREMLYSPLTVIIGRQVFAYGNSFVIDASGTNNNVAEGGLNGIAEDFTKRTALNAIRMVLDYNPLTIDVVFAKVDENTVVGLGAHDDDVDLYGANANYQIGDEWNTVVEGYFWAKIDQSTKTGGVGRKNDTVYMPGARVSTNPIKGLNLQAEGAMQRGNKATTLSGGDNVHREAQGGQIIANYMLPFESTAQWSPVVTGVYTYVSGDSGPAEAGTLAGDDHYNAWDPMFENQGGGTIYNTLFNLTNAHIVGGKLAIKPIQDVTTTVTWDRLWLDKALDDGDFSGDCSGATCLTLLQPDGTTLTPKMTTNTMLGDEFGAGVVYDYTEDVQIGARVSAFVPGGAFHEDNNEAAYQSVVNANVKF
ncbi:MAG: hypothetical protein Q8Q08_07905 [Candidatus Omnitrophota bacterium]|nr:hypothetical protein [Candidatus Omnitrophota bacterium]MDZ4243107.1 hypothetical protein [Candidatus Omnitrophota bacterium]